MATSDSIPVGSIVLCSVTAGSDESDRANSRYFFEIGVRKSDAAYTSPVLSVHRYKHSQHEISGAQGKSIAAVDRKRRQTGYVGERNLKQREKFSAEEEVLMIPWKMSHM